MSRKIRNVNAMLKQLSRIQEQLRNLRELIEEEVGKGVTKMFLEGASADEIYHFVEKIIVGSGYLDYLKLKKEKERRMREKRKEKEENEKKENEKKLDVFDEKFDEKSDDDANWA